jgi:hypothetical protein
VNAADAPGAEKPAGKTNGDAYRIDLESLKEQLQKLSDRIRAAIEAATGEAAPESTRMQDGGIGGLAPKVTGRSLQSIYGPDGPTIKSVSALLAYRLVLLGNPRLRAGRVYEKDGWIVAEVVTTKERSLVARYLVNKNSGAWVPQR